MTKQLSISYLVNLVGGPSVLAKHIGITPQAISQWPHVPIKHVQVVCELSGLSPEQVRPDVYCWINHTPSNEKDIRA